MFTSIFTITTHPARVVIPETFAKKVKSWLGNKEELFNSVKKQVTQCKTYQKYKKNIHVWAYDRFIKVNYGKSSKID